MTYPNWIPAISSSSEILYDIEFVIWKLLSQIRVLQKNIPKTKKDIKNLKKAINKYYILYQGISGDYKPFENDKEKKLLEIYDNEETLNQANRETRFNLLDLKNKINDDVQSEQFISKAFHNNLYFSVSEYADKRIKDIFYKEIWLKEFMDKEKDQVKVLNYICQKIYSIGYKEGMDTFKDISMEKSLNCVWKSILSSEIFKEIWWDYEVVTNELAWFYHISLILKIWDKSYYFDPTNNSEVIDITKILSNSSIKWDSFLIDLNDYFFNWYIWTKNSGEIELKKDSTIMLALDNIISKYMNNYKNIAALNLLRIQDSYEPNNAYIERRLLEVYKRLIEDNEKEYKENKLSKNEKTIFFSNIEKYMYYFGKTEDLSNIYNKVWLAKLYFLKWDIQESLDYIYDVLKLDKSHDIYFLEWVDIDDLLRKYEKAGWSNEKANFIKNNLNIKK